MDPSYAPILPAAISGTQPKKSSGLGSESLSLQGAALGLSGDQLLLDQRSDIWSHARVRHLLSGETLVVQNTPADAVFLVASGRFEIRIEGRTTPVTEVGVGHPIGEIAFFAGGLRTASAVAVRDSIVLELDRAAFFKVVSGDPAVYYRLLTSLAGRLAETTARIESSVDAVTPRTLALVQAGQRRIPDLFILRLQRAFAARGKCLFLSSADLKQRFPDLGIDDPSVVSWLNAIESEYELILYLTDAEPTNWTRKAIRQADQLVLLGYGPAPPDLNSVEEIGLAFHPPSHRSLIRIHDQRISFTAGTSKWLRKRDVAMHHHVSIEDDRDFKRLHRFFTGRAVGFVAGGGGGFGPAHAGIFKAFQERGVEFDILGGSSVGAAVLGGFAQLFTPAELDLALEDVFVASRGFKRRTLPRYSLLDHIALDKALRRLCRGAHIEDLWIPYFAVATDVDCAAQSLHLFRRGPLWKAVRASCSIPAILPPMFTDDGRMLVDGAVVENIPLSSMKRLKSGPNLVVYFDAPPAGPHAVNYESIPGRWELLGRLLNPFARKKLPNVPGPADMLRRCFNVRQGPALLPTGPHDLLLAPPPFPGSSFIDFDRHSDVLEAAYQWCTIQLDRLEAIHDPALEAILAAKG